MVHSRNRKIGPRQLAFLVASALLLLPACSAPGGASTGPATGSSGGIAPFPKGHVTLTLLDYQGSSNPAARRCYQRADQGIRGGAPERYYQAEPDLIQ